MPSLPVRGFGKDGLLVTGGVGAAEAAELQTIIGSGAQVGLLGVQAGRAVAAAGTYVALPVVSVAASVSRNITARGSQRGLIGVQRGAGGVRMGRTYLTALFDLDVDLYAAAMKEAA